MVLSALVGVAVLLPIATQAFNKVVAFVCSAVTAMTLLLPELVPLPIVKYELVKFKL